MTKKWLGPMNPVGFIHDKKHRSLMLVLHAMEQLAMEVRDVVVNLARRVGIGLPLRSQLRNPSDIGHPHSLRTPILGATLRCKPSHTKSTSILAQSPLSLLVEFDIEPVTPIALFE